jgi:hypothetical protein
MADTPQLISDTTISGVLKNVYAAFREDSFPIATPLLAQLKKAKPGGPERMQWGGNGVYWDVKLTRPVGMTGSQLGYFPPHAVITEQQANVGIKRTYVTRQIDALADSGTQSKEAAFVNITRKIVEEALDAARLGQQEVLHGDGNGIKGVTTTVGSSVSVVVTKPYGIASSGQGGLLLDAGMYVAVTDSTGATVRGRSVITSVTNSGDNATVIFTTGITGMTTTDLVVAATTSDTSYGNMPNGLTNLLNVGGSYNTLHGINASTYARWDTTRLVAGTDTDDAGQPTEMDAWKLIRVVAGKSGKDAQMNPGEFLLLTTPGIVKKLGETFLGQRRWDMGMKTLEGGFGALELCGLPVISDYWCPAGTIYLVHTPSLSWVDKMDWTKLVFEGAGPWRFIAGRDAYEVDFGAYWNTAVLNRICHGMITGYTDTVRFSHVM